MKRITARNFIREFSRCRAEACLVTDHGRVLGFWIPAEACIRPVDFGQRVRRDFSRRLPFTGQELLKEGKTR